MRIAINLINGDISNSIYTANSGIWPVSGLSHAPPINYIRMNTFYVKIPKGVRTHIPLILDIPSLSSPIFLTLRCCCRCIPLISQRYMSACVPSLIQLCLHILNMLAKFTNIRHQVILRIQKQPLKSHP